MSAKEVTMKEIVKYLVNRLDQEDMLGFGGLDEDTVKGWVMFSDEPEKALDNLYHKFIGWWQGETKEDNV